MMHATPTIGKRGTRGRLASGLLFGVGLAAFADETIFHQLLHWHHFYDKSTPAIGLVSDGLFHAFSWFATVAGLYLLADARRRGSMGGPAYWWGAVLLGAGAFQLYDGTFQHKVLQIHQIRYGVELLPYDATWIVSAIVMMGISLFLLRRRERG